MSKPKTIAEVVRQVVEEAVMNDMAEYKFRGVIYAAKVARRESGELHGEVWMVGRGLRCCIGDNHIFRAGFETLPHGEIEVGTGYSDFYNSIYFNKDGTIIPAGTWR